MPPSELRHVLAANIRELVEKRRMTLSSLCDSAKVSRSHFFEIMNCNSSATIDVVARVARALEVEPWELLRRE
ncbi:MAG: helix-turn-helix transcriptional regulator [Myxococcota bacterium]